MPYNQSFMLRKHMVFEDKEDEDVSSTAVNRKPSTSGLEDIFERIEAEKAKAQVSILEENSISIDESKANEQDDIPLRDKEFTKE